MQIVFLDAATVADLPDELAKFSALGEFISYENTTPEEVVPRLREADVAVVNKVVLREAELAQLPQLKLICVAATGMNNISLSAAANRGIPVRNVSGYSTEAVAQLTLTMLFTMSMDLIHLNEAVYDGTYSRHHSFAYWRQPFYELKGAQYGIIGMGSIGRRVAELATAYGAQVVYYSSSGRNHDQPYPQMSLEELLRTSAVVSVHCPLNERTENLIDYAALEKMQDWAYLINVARGGVVKEADLVRALNEGQIAGAAVDVFSREPIPENHPYFNVRERHRLLLTPHMGWASVEARMELLAGVRANIEKGWT
ncbi:NAD(P)-dependent oxidoreductase [Lewinella sp. W8]|uniref:NAD(P)-dependent oxidoreductase n=1 Tax=Lewinella sp. W8 TaxID=2528208 RepID=UPI0010686CA3|nr:NAD(P)-dependent oxidoreductase [Lewinella sp. W8]MTB53486.1 hydroxyacid dehydrogenase [Lewinella sp. W8]